MFHCLHHLHRQTLQHQNIPHFFYALRDHDIKIALNTGYNREIQKLLIDKFELNDCIDDYISSEEVKKGRPQPFMIKELMKRNSIDDSNQVIKIGDTVADIFEGKNARCKTVAVLSGSETKKLLVK